MFPVMSPSCFLGSKLLGKGVPLPFNFLSPSNPPRPSPAQPAQPAGSVHSGTPILMELAPPASRPHRRVWCLETQHPRQGDLGPQCAHPGWEHLPPPPPPPPNSPQILRWCCAPQVPPGAGPTLSGPKHPPLQLGVGKSLCGAQVAPHPVGLALGVACGFVFIFLWAKLRFCFIQTGCPLLPIKCRHFNAPITVYV